MKKILTFLLMVISSQMFAQNYPVSSINITLPVNPDPNTANWGSGTSVFIINATARAKEGNIENQVIESKILVTIKKGGDKVCGSYTSSNAPPSNFNSVSKVWSGQNAVSLLGKDCILKTGNYTVCVQLFGLRGDPLSEEKCRPFSVIGEESQSYQPPQAISPANGTTLSEKDAKMPITFRWTPVVPRPNNEVIYKVKLIEIRQGQSATAAMKSASPIFEKEVVNQTQMVMTSLSPHPIAKDSKYGWYVQATNKEGKTFGGNNGNSGVNVFKSGNIIDIQIDSISMSCCLGGKQNLYLKVKNNLSGNVKIMTIGYRKNVTGPLVDISSLINPPLAAIIAGNGVKIFNSSINCIDNVDSLKLVVYATDPNDPDVFESEKATTKLRCPCTACNSIRIDIPANGVISLDSTIKLQTPVIVSPGNVKKIKTQLVSFEYKPESNDCVPCNRDTHNWGNFISASLNDHDFNANGILNWGHELQWNSRNANGANLNGTFNFNISLPPIVKCCKVKMKFCIRYIFELDNCVVCEKLVCYSYPLTNK